MHSRCQSIISRQTQVLADITTLDMAIGNDKQCLICTQSPYLLLLSSSLLSCIPRDCGLPRHGSFPLPSLSQSLLRVLLHQGKHLNEYQSNHNETSTSKGASALHVSAVAAIAVRYTANSKSHQAIQKTGLPRMEEGCLVVARHDAPCMSTDFSSSLTGCWV